MSANAWANQYLGQQIADNSGNYRGECVSFIKRYAQEAQNVPNADSVLYVPEDKAKNMWLKFTPAMAKYYDKVNVPKVGDIAVYNGGQYGDVAVYIGGGKVVGQLGTPVFRPVAIRPVGSPIGYLRRKGNMNQGDVIANIRRGLLDRLWNGAGVDPSRVKDEVAATDEALSNIDAKNRTVNDLTRKLEIAQAAAGDGTKWQTLKALIKQLIS